MTDMTITANTIKDRVEAGVPTGGQFAAKTRAEADALGALMATEVDSGLTAAQAKAFTESHLANLDAAADAQDTVESQREDALFEGQKLAHAELAAVALLGPGKGKNSYQASADRIIEDRAELSFLEQADSFNGPGELSINDRQANLDYIRDRESEAFMSGETSTGPQAELHYAMAEVFASAADELSGDATQFTGGQDL